MMKKYCDFELSKLVPWAQSGSQSKGKKFSGLAGALSISILTNVTNQIFEHIQKCRMHVITYLYDSYVKNEGLCHLHQILMGQISLDQDRSQDLGEQPYTKRKLSNLWELSNLHHPKAVSSFFILHSSSKQIILISTEELNGQTLD